MSSKEKSGKFKRRKKKEKLYLSGDQSFIPILHEGHEEFLRVRGKETVNPEMELILAAEESSKKHKKITMNFGVTSPLPWEIQLTSHEQKCLKEAKAQVFRCKNRKCRSYNQTTQHEYTYIVHKKPPFKNKEGEELGRSRICHHIGVKCKICNRLIKYVRFNKANRRLAEDPWLVRHEPPEKRKGKHEQRRR